MASGSFHFEFDHDLIVIPLEIDGKDSLRVVLDTGMTGDGLYLFNTPKVAEIGFNASKNQPANGDSSKKPSNLINGVVLDFPGFRLPNQSALLLKHNPFPPQQAIDGIVGYALFSRYTVLLNFEKTLFRCWTPSEFNSSDGYQMLPLSFRRGFPYIPCTVEIQDEVRVPIQAFLDLGMNAAISLNAGSHDEFKFSDDAIDSEVSSAMGGSVPGRAKRITSLDIGGYSLNRVMAISCEGNLVRGVEQKVVHEGNIGTGILNCFNIILDYPNSRLFLKPNESFARPANKSGISVRKMKTGNFQVQQIAPDSPASEAGLRASDIILKVNGMQSNQIGISEINQIFDADNVTFDVVVSRDLMLLKYLVTPRLPE